MPRNIKKKKKKCHMFSYFVSPNLVLILDRISFGSTLKSRLIQMKNKIKKWLHESELGQCYVVKLF